ncbi:MAG: antibiotic biosynthesis monooxygenase family protein [Actinomycetota bacterium]
MIVEYIRYRIESDRSEEFVEAYRHAAVPLAESEHCIDYELSRCVEEPERFVLRIRWDSLDGHLHGFRGSEQFRRFVAHVRPFIPMIEEMQHYEVGEVVGDGAGSTQR